MGMQATTTLLSQARNQYIKVGHSFIFDRVGDMIYKAAAILDKANTFTKDNTFSGASIRMTGTLASEGLANPYISIGSSSSSIEITNFADNVLGVGTWFKLKKNAAKSLLGAYFKVETDGSTDVANAQLVAVAPRVTVDTALDSAYGVQSHMTISGTKSSSELISISAYTELGSGARTADRVCALQAMINGSGTAGTVTGDCFVAYIANRGTVITTDAVLCVHNQSSAGATAMVKIENESATAGRVTDIFNIDAGNSTNFLNFASVEGCVSSQAGGTLTITEKLKVKIGANTRYIPVGTIA